MRIHIESDNLFQQLTQQKESKRKIYKVLMAK